MRMTSEDKSGVNSYTNNGAFDPRSRTQTFILIYETCFQNNLKLLYCDILLGKYFRRNKHKNTQEWLILTFIAPKVPDS